VKPNVEGTSKGVYDSSVVHDDGQLLEAMDRLSSTSISNILVEEYIQGREFTAGILAYPRLEVLGPTEIAFKSGKQFPVYSFEAKQLENQLDNEHFRMVCPAEISDNVLRKIRYFAKKCFRAVGARDVARIDFRMQDDGTLFFIEINPLPGLTPGYSDLAIMIEKMGMSYEELIRRILYPAIARWRKTS
jgi:D-alanine-D-alanine ligase